MIRVEDASLVYQDHGKEVFACRNISIEIHKGEFLGILGPSGSGKSSLLYMLCGLKHPTGGTVKLGDQVLKNLSDLELCRLRIEKFGFVFQYPYLLGYLSMLENVLIACPNQDKKEEAEDLLNQLGLLEKGHRFPHELSGGERQRTCIARALLGQPEIIFADEPTANLDHKNGFSVVETLVSKRGFGSLVMVTHDPTMLEGADRVLVMNDGSLSDSNSI